MKIKEFLERYIFIRKCAGCSELIGYDERRDAFCPACRIKWEMAKARPCSRCGSAAVECECMPKLLSKSGMQTLKKLILYSTSRQNEPENKMLYFLKHNKNKRVSAFAAEQLSHRVHELMRETGMKKEDFVLTYIPRTKRALAEYGFDQSKMVLDELSRICKVEAVELFERRKHGKEQKKLHAEARAKNAAKGIILVEDAEKLTGERAVIIFDDIVSSGASMARATELLRKAQVRNIFGISIAFSD